MFDFDVITCDLNYLIYLISILFLNAPAGNRTRGYCLEGNNVTTTPPGLNKRSDVSPFPI